MSGTRGEDENDDMDDTDKILELKKKTKSVSSDIYCREKKKEKVRQRKSRKRKIEKKPATPKEVFGWQWKELAGRDGFL